MGISIYYTARRSFLLTENESATISQVKTEYDAKAKEFTSRSIGDDWESFCIYNAANSSEPNVIFEGATMLPDDSKEAAWASLQHWCKAITQIRRQVSGAEWLVHVGDREITWDNSAQKYDPSR